MSSDNGKYNFGAKSGDHGNAKSVKSTIAIAKIPLVIFSLRVRFQFVSICMTYVHTKKFFKRFFLF